MADIDRATTGRAAQPATDGQPDAPRSRIQRAMGDRQRGRRGRAGVGADLADRFRPAGPRRLPVHHQSQGTGVDDSGRRLARSNRASCSTARAWRSRWPPTAAMSIPVSGDPEQGRHLLELRYQFPERPRRGQMSLELPRLGDNVWARRMYWQVVVPRDEHLLLSPQGFAGEYAWGWSGFLWGRRPSLDQAELERWVARAPRRASRRKPISICSARSATSVAARS